MQKKVLVIINVAWNLHNFRKNIIDRLVEDGFDVYLAAQEDGYEKLLKSENVTFIPLKKLYRTTKNPFKDLLLIRELFSLVKSVKPDFTIHYTIKPNIYGGLVTSILKVPYFSVVTGLGYAFINNGWLRSLTLIMYKVGLKNCKQVIFENNDDLQLFLDEGIIQPTMGTAVNGCGVDTDYFQAECPLKEDNRLIFTYIGRLLYDKGLKELMAAFERIKAIYPTSELWIVGKRDIENPACISNSDYADWIERKGVSYKGYTDDVRPYIEKSTCIIYPSYREGMPRLVLEAMAMQKPVITTDVPGCRDTVIHRESGIIVPPKDEDALHDAMKAIGKNDPLDLAVMGEKARKRAISLFKDTIISEHLIDIFYKHLDFARPELKTKKIKSFEARNS